MTKKELLEAIEDMPMDATIVMSGDMKGFKGVTKIHYNKQFKEIEMVNNKNAVDNFYEIILQEFPHMVKLIQQNALSEVKDYLSGMALRYTPVEELMNTVNDCIGLVSLVKRMREAQNRVDMLAGGEDIEFVDMLFIEQREAEREVDEYLKKMEE